MHKPENRQTLIFSLLALRCSTRPVLLLPGQATQLMVLSPKCPWDAGKEQAAAMHAAATVYEREPLQSDVPQRQDTSTMTQRREVESYI